MSTGYRDSNIQSDREGHRHKIKRHGQLKVNESKSDGDRENGSNRDERPIIINECEPLYLFGRIVQKHTCQLEQRLSTKSEMSYLFNHFM